MDWRLWIGAGGLLAAILAMQLHSSSSGPSVVSYSGLLDWDLLGTLPHADQQKALKQLNEEATRQGISCAESEVYQVTNSAQVKAVLDDAQAERHYFRYRNKRHPAISEWEGPNHLLMVETDSELFLCAIVAPLSG